MKIPAILSTTLLLVACSTANPGPSTDTGAVLPLSSSSAASSLASSSIQPASPNFPFVLPEGFSGEIFTDDLPGARVIVQDLFGNYWVSQSKQGLVTQLDLQSGPTVMKNAIFRGLRNPHGLAIDPENGLDLYIAEEDKILKARLYSDAPVVTVATLPKGGRHTTRTLGIGKDGRLYVALGSTCDVCNETDERISTIMSMNKDGTDQKIIAKGLRNAVFFTWRPGTEELWATEMGRDRLGDVTPPDEVNKIVPGANYGWPYCYGDKLRDTSFDAKTNYDCSQTTPPDVALPAHVAPLGIAFAPSTWSADLRGDMLVAEHGSWNSSEKVGYKIVRMSFDAAGKPTASQDFITGFLKDGKVEGRPVDLFINKDNSLFITDDEAGAVYRVWQNNL